MNTIRSLLMCLSLGLPSLLAAQDLEETRRAAEAGDPEAQLELGFLYLDGELIQRDYDEMLKWWRKSAEQGFVEAQFNLGVIYETGQIVSQDYDEAAKWFRKSAEQGDAESQVNLGAMYANGHGVRQDFAEAYVWSSLAAASGHPGGIHNRDRSAENLSADALAEARQRAIELAQEIQARIRAQ